MAKSKLNDKQKARALELLAQGVSQKDVASYFNVSQRTIHRIREEHGLVETRRFLSDQEKDFLKLMHEVKLPVTQVRMLLNQTPLTPTTVVEAVANMDDSQLGRFLYNVSKVRIAREYQAQQAAAARARASNGEMKQEPLYG